MIFSARSTSQRTAHLWQNFSRALRLCARQRQKGIWLRLRRAAVKNSVPFVSRRHWSGGGGLADVQTQSEAGLLSIGRGAVDDAGFCGFIERGTKASQGSDGVLFFSGVEQVGVFLFESMQPGLDAVIAQAFGCAVAHSTPGRTSIGHNSTIVLEIEAGTVPGGECLSMVFVSIIVVVVVIVIVIASGRWPDRTDQRPITIMITITKKKDFSGIEFPYLCVTISGRVLSTIASSSFCSVLAI